MVQLVGAMLAIVLTMVPVRDERPKAPSRRASDPLLVFLSRYSTKRPLPRGSAVVLGILIAALFWAVSVGPNLPRWVGLGQALATLGVVGVAAVAGPRLLLRLTATGLVALGAFLWAGMLAMLALQLVNGPRGAEWAVALAAILGAEVAGQYTYRWTKQRVPLVLATCIVAFAVTKCPRRDSNTRHQDWEFAV